MRLLSRLCFCVGVFRVSGAWRTRRMSNVKAIYNSNNNCNLYLYDENERDTKLIIKHKRKQTKKNTRKDTKWKRNMLAVLIDFDDWIE